MKKLHTLFKYLCDPTHPIYIAVVGIGGTGGHVMSGLAQISSALKQLNRVSFHVTAYDPDIVTEDNIGRQHFSPSDIGEYKSIVLTERINRFYGYDWDAVPAKYFIENEREGYNIVISCVDTLKSRKEINKINNSVTPYYYREIFYWMDIGNGRNYGQIIMGSYEKPEPSIKMPNFFEEFKNPKEIDPGISCSAYMKYNQQDLFINKIMADFACNMIWKLLRNYCIDYRGCYINLDPVSIAKIPIEN